MHRGGVYTTLDSAITALDKAQVAVVVAAGNDGDYLMNYSPGRASGCVPCALQMHHNSCS